MFLVEVIMQGVRNFQQMARIRFKGGFNFVVAGSEGGKTTAVDAIIRLLYPVNDAARMASLVSRESPETSLGALTVLADDQVYYQVKQAFSKSAVNFSQYDINAKKFVLQTKEWKAAAQSMVGMLQNVAEEDYSRLFVFRRDACAGLAAAGAVPHARKFMQATSGAGSGPAENAKLRELRETLRKAEDAADAEYKAESARSRLADIGNKLQRIAEAEKQIAELETSISDMKACETIPVNLAEMISDHEQEQSQKMVKIGEVDNDIEGLTAQRDSMPPANLLMEKFFIGGAALVAVSLIAGLFLLSDDQSYFFPVGILGGLLLGVTGWYNSSRKSAQRREVQKEIDNLVKERAEIEKKFQDGGATIMRFMKTTGSTSAVDLKDKADRYRHLQDLLAERREQHRVLLSEQTLDQVQEEYGKRRDEVMTLEQAAKAVAHHAVDTYSIRQEIERLEGEAVQGVSDRGAVGPDAADLGEQSLAATTGAGLNVLAEVAIASRMSGIEMETLVPAVESAAQRNVAAVSTGKYLRIEIGPDGQPLLHDRTGGKHDYATLSHGTREMTYFCLRTALVEAIAGKRRLPFLLDDPLAGMDSPHQQAASNVLRTLGAKTQVILFTSDASLRAPADAFTELK